MEKTLKNKYAALGKYVLVKTLGTGYNSRVKLGYDASSNQYCAVKIIKHSHPNLNLKTLKKEIEMLSLLSHPNIVNLLEFHETIDYIKKSGQTYKVVAIMMELVPGGELFEYVADTGSFSEEIARKFFRTLIETLEYCHGQGIAHRDLKPENLLFDAGFRLKVADFGFATLLAGKDGSGVLYTILGTEGYMAPEINLRKPYLGNEVDLFASAIILFIMISGTPPFGKADPKNDPHYKLFSSGKQEVFWKAHERGKPKKAGQANFYSDDFRNMMNAMMALEPGSRLTIEQIKEHAWYQGAVVSDEDIKVEFLKRKKLVDAELQRQKEAKLREKEMAKKATFAQGAFTGVKPFRSLEVDMEASIDKELQEKVNFEAKRELYEYQEQVGFKAYTEVFTVLDHNAVFKLLCSLSKKNFADFSVSENAYKIKGKAVVDQGSCNLNILLSKVDENTTCIEFQKTSGNVMTFYKVIENIKKDLPHVEEAKDESKEENVEAATN